MGRKHKQSYRKKQELLYSHALKRFLKHLEDQMPVAPDAILNSIKPLNESDRAQVDQLEKELDQFLTDNFHEDAVLSWTLPVVITLDQTRDLCNRYRKVGWRVFAYGEPESRFLILSRDSRPSEPKPESDRPC